MKERPILFSGPMVRSILDGRKTQTRRKVKPEYPAISKFSHSGARLFHVEQWPKCAREIGNFGRTDDLLCHYGQPGDLLWVKETHWRWGEWVRNGVTKTGRPAWRFKPVKRLDRPFGAAFDDLNDEPLARRTQLGWHKRPSIFLRRVDSRITLEITRVRVERLNDISVGDCLAEGIIPPWSSKGPTLGSAKVQEDTLRDIYFALWDSINGKGEWVKNPWVWVVQLVRL